MRSKNDPDKPENWKATPKIPYDSTKKDYTQVITDLNPDEDYYAEYDIVDDDSGKIVDHIPSHLVKNKPKTYGTPGANTVEVENDGEKLTIDWNMDNVEQNSDEKSLRVSCQFTVA